MLSIAVGGGGHVHVRYWVHTLTFVHVFSYSVFISLVTQRCLCGGKKCCIILRYHMTTCMYMHDADLKNTR